MQIFTVAFFEGAADNLIWEWWDFLHCGFAAGTRCAPGGG